MAWITFIVSAAGIVYAGILLTKYAFFLIFTKIVWGDVWIHKRPATETLEHQGPAQKESA